MEEEEGASGIVDIPKDITPRSHNRGVSHYRDSSPSAPLP